MIRSTQELGARTYYNWRLGIETLDFWNQYLKEPSVERKKYLYLIYSYVAVSRLIYIFLLHFLNTLLFITTSGCYKGCICTLNIAFGTLGLLGIWKQDNITELGIFWYLDLLLYFACLSSQVYGWGRGEHGRLGFGDDKSSKMVPQKVQLLVEENIVQVELSVSTI